MDRQAVSKHVNLSKSRHRFSLTMTTLSRIQVRKFFSTLPLINLSPIYAWSNPRKRKSEDQASLHTGGDQSTVKLKEVQGDLRASAQLLNLKFYAQQSTEALQSSCNTHNVSTIENRTLPQRHNCVVMAGRNKTECMQHTSTILRNSSRNLPNG